MSSSLWDFLFTVILVIGFKLASSADLNATTVSSSSLNSSSILNTSEVTTNYSNKTDLDEKSPETLKKEDAKHIQGTEKEKKPSEENEQLKSNKEKEKNDSQKNESDKKKVSGTSRKQNEEKQKKKAKKKVSWKISKTSHFSKPSKTKNKESAKENEEEEYDSEYTSTSYDDPSSNEYHENDEYYAGEGHGYDSSYTDNGNGQPQQIDQGYNYNYNVHPNKNTPMDSQLYEYKSFPIQSSSSPAYPFQNYEEPNYASDNYTPNIGSSIANIGMDGAGPSIGNVVQGSLGATALEPAFRSAPLGQASIGSAGLTPDEYRQLEDGFQPITSNQLANQPDDIGAYSYVKKRTQNNHKFKKKNGKIGRKTHVVKISKQAHNSSSIKHSKIEKSYKRTIMIGNRVCGSKKHIDIHYQGEISKKGEVVEDISSSLRATDICCNEHNECQRVVPAKSTKYGFQNDIEYDIMACSCDAKFRTCLKNANSYTADAVGHLYFNTLKIPCLTFEQEIIPDVKNSMKKESNIVSVVPDVETEREVVGGAQLVVSPRGLSRMENDKEMVKGLWNKLIGRGSSVSKDNILEPLLATSSFRANAQQTVLKTEPEDQLVNMSIKRIDHESEALSNLLNNKEDQLTASLVHKEDSLAMQHLIKDSEQLKLPQSDNEKHIYYVKKLSEEPVTFQKDEDQFRYQTDHFRIQNESEQLRSHKEHEIQNLQKEIEHFQKQSEQNHIQKDIYLAKFQKESDQPHIQKEIEQPRNQKEVEQPRNQKEIEQNHPGLEIEQQRIRLQKEIEQMQEQENNLEKIKKRKRPNIMNPNPSPNNPNPYSKLRGVVTVPEAYYPRVSLY